MYDGGRGWRRAQDNKAFNNKSVWARISVVAAGPVFNFIMALVSSPLSWSAAPVMTFRYSSGCECRVMPRRRQGLQAGDTIVKMGGKHIHFYREVSAYSMYHAGETGESNLRAGREERYTTELTPKYDEDDRKISVRFYRKSGSEREDNESMYSRWQSTVLTRWSTGSTRHWEA